MHASPDPGPTPGATSTRERTRRTRRLLLPVTVGALAVVAATTVATAAVVVSHRRSPSGAVAGPVLAFPGRPSVTTSAPGPTPVGSSTGSTPPTPPVPPGSPVRPARGPAVDAAPPTLFAHPGVPAPAGGELARGAIPWTQVGSGWFIAGWANAATSDDKHPSVLYLVSPAGRHYQLAYFPTGEPRPVLWSPDGRRVLMWGAYDNRTDTQPYLELTLATGALRTVSDADASPVTYTRPSGTALLFAEINGAAKIRLDGTRELTYPSAVPGVGPVTYDSAAYSPDGSRLAVAGRTGLAILTNAGQVRQVVNLPNHAPCHPDRWIAGQVLQFTCGSDVVQDEYSLRIGSGAVQLTHVGSDPLTSDLTTMWSTSAGRFALAAQSCGPSRLVRIDSAGRSSLVPVPLPPGLSGTLAPQGHSADRVLFTVADGQCMPRRRSLLSYDVGTGRSVALLTGVGAYGTATGGVAPWFTDR